MLLNSLIIGFWLKLLPYLPKLFGHTTENKLQVPQFWLWITIRLKVIGHTWNSAHFLLHSIIVESFLKSQQLYKKNLSIQKVCVIWMNFFQLTWSNSTSSASDIPLLEHQIAVVASWTRFFLWWTKWNNEQEIENSSYSLSFSFVSFLFMPVFLFFSLICA